MKRLNLSQSPRTAAARRNVLAIAIGLFAAGVVFVNFDPLPKGSEHVRRPSAPPPGPPVAVAPRPSVVAAAVDSPAATAELEQAHFSTPTSHPLEGHAAIAFYLSVLEQGYSRLLSIPAYTATFVRQERVDGELSDCQRMHLKLRHDPYSVYLKWLTGDVGREVLYVNGQNEGKLLVRIGGWKGRLMPPLKLDPDGSLATEDSRYPITKLGLLELARTLIADRQSDLQRLEFVRCRMEDQRECNERSCYYFDLEYDSPAVSPVYRKSELFVDKEWSLPVFIRNYGWPDGQTELADVALDECTLIEHYLYADLQLDAQLADPDFDRNNSDYRFRR